MATDDTTHIKPDNQSDKAIAAYYSRLTQALLDGVQRLAVFIGGCGTLVLMLPTCVALGADAEASPNLHLGALFKLWVFAGLLYFPGSVIIATVAVMTRVIREDNRESAARAAREAAAVVRASEAARAAHTGAHMGEARTAARSASE